MRAEGTALPGPRTKGLLLQMPGDGLLPLSDGGLQVHNVQLEYDLTNPNRTLIVNMKGSA